MMKESKWKTISIQYNNKSFMTGDSNPTLKVTSVRLRQDQITFLNSLKNGSTFLRDAIDLKRALTSTNSEGDRTIYLAHKLSELNAEIKRVQSEQECQSALKATGVVEDAQQLLAFIDLCDEWKAKTDWKEKAGFDYIQSENLEAVKFRGNTIANIDSLLDAVNIPFKKIDLDGMFCYDVEIIGTTPAFKRYAQAVQKIFSGYDPREDKYAMLRAEIMKGKAKVDIDTLAIAKAVIEGYKQKVESLQAEKEEIIFELRGL